MTVLDTCIVMDRIRGKAEIREDITVVTMVEFPPILRYSKFSGRVIYPVQGDYETAYKLQENLRKIGKPKPFSDLLIASICLNREEELVTSDEDFRDVSQVSKLKLKFIEDLLCSVEAWQRLARELSVINL